MTDHPDDPLDSRATRRNARDDDDDDDDDDDLDERAALDDPYDDELKDELKEGREGRGFATKVIGDLAKRALMTGIGAVFMSEESLKSQLSDMKLPKEAMNYVVGQADKTKKEIVTAIARETRDFLSKMEMDKVLARVLAGTTIEIQTRIKILPKEGGGLTTAVETQHAALVRDDKDTKDEKANEPERPRKKKRKQDDEA